MLAFENRAKTVENQVAILQWKVQEQQSQAQEKRATTDRITELEAELQETVAQGGEIFVVGQNSVKKELVKSFPIENFAWIDNIFLEEEEDKQEGQTEDNHLN